MEKYTAFLKSQGAFAAVEIEPSMIVTAPWVVMKCRYGCPRYGHNRSCPPFAPDYQETSRILASYRHAILFGVHSMTEGTPLALDCLRMLGIDGNYKAIGFGTGPCTQCAECKLTECPQPHTVLPSPEACGIDLVATVRAAGLPIDVPPLPAAPLCCYGIILVD